MMRKKLWRAIVGLALIFGMLSGCGSSAQSETAEKITVEDTTTENVSTEEATTEEMVEEPGVNVVKYSDYYQDSGYHSREEYDIDGRIIYYYSYVNDKVREWKEYSDYDSYGNPRCQKTFYYHVAGEPEKGAFSDRYVEMEYDEKGNCTKKVFHDIMEIYDEDMELLNSGGNRVDDYVEFAYDDRNNVIQEYWYYDSDEIGDFVLDPYSSINYEYVYNEQGDVLTTHVNYVAPEYQDYAYSYEYDYEYNEFGKIVKCQETRVESSMAIDIKITHYEYDYAGNLIEEKEYHRNSDGEDELTHWYQYTYYSVAVIDDEQKEENEEANQ